jgi:hypothetical protein
MYVYKCVCQGWRQGGSRWDCKIVVFRLDHAAESTHKYGVMNMCVCTYTLCVYVYMHVLWMKKHVYVCVYIGCMHLYACMCSVNLSIRICVYMYTRASKNTWTHIHTRTAGCIHIYSIPYFAFVCPEPPSDGARHDALRAAAAYPHSVCAPEQHSSHDALCARLSSCFTTLTLPVPEQVSQQQPNHDAAWGRVPGSHVASNAVSSGVLLILSWLHTWAHKTQWPLLQCWLDVLRAPSQWSLQQSTHVLLAIPCHNAGINVQLLKNLPSWGNNSLGLCMSERERERERTNLHYAM